MMGFFLLMAAGNDSTKATYCSGDARADGEPRAARRCCSTTPRSCPARSRRRCGCSRPSRTSAARPRTTPSCTARRSRRARRSSCGTCPRTATRRATRIPTASTSRRNPEHQAFGAGGRHFCLGTALARLELRILIEETLSATPRSSSTSAEVRRIAVRQPAQDAAGPPPPERLNYLICGIAPAAPLAPQENPTMFDPCDREGPAPAEAQR